MGGAFGLFSKKRNKTPSDEAAAASSDSEKDTESDSSDSESDTPESNVRVLAEDVATQKVVRVVRQKTALRPQVRI